MISIKACILVAFMLLIFNELGIGISFASSNDKYSPARSKRSLTTICVEIKPSGPLEEPYYMCKGAEFPGFQKTSPQQLSNNAGNNQPVNKNIGPSYVKTDNYRTPYNSRDETYDNGNYQNPVSHYDSSTGNDKNSNGLVGTIKSHPQIYGENIEGGRGRSSGTNIGSPSSERSFDGFQNHPPPSSFHKPSEQYQQFHETDYNQHFQPQSHQLPSPPTPQPWPFHNQQRQQVQQNRAFHQPKTNFRPSMEKESSVSAPDDFTNYFQNTNRQPTKQPPIFPTYSDGYSGDLSSRSFLNSHTTYPSYGSTVYSTPQHKGDATECGDDCEKPTSAAAPAAVASKNFDSRYNEKPVFHNGPNSAAPKKSNAATIPPGNDKVSTSFKNDPYAFPNVARTQPQPASGFREPKTFDTNDESFLSSVDANLPNSMNIRIPPRVDYLRGANLMQRQFQPILPAAHRYRAMIDDEVFQVPNWGFSTDELDFYRAAPDIDTDILALRPTPRTIPIEHLADPVMRSFYSSLPDVGPLPIYKPANTVVYTYSKFPKQQQPTTFATPSPPPPPPPPLSTPTPTIPQRSKETNPSCSPCQGYSQNSNYDSCRTLGGHNFQPVFVAVPCYNPSVFQPMMPQIQIAPFNNNDYKQFRMMNPLEVPYSPSTTTSLPIYHTEAHPSSKKDLRFDPVATTTSTTLAYDSNESSESLEETLTPKESQNSKVNNSNISDEKDSRSKETQKPIVEKPNGSKSNINNKTTQSPATETVSASYSVTTPSSADSVDDLNTAAQSRTTFKSLVLNARKLAQMNTNSDEFNQYFQDISTPRSSPKKQRQASRDVVPGNGHGKRKFMHQM